MDTIQTIKINRWYRKLYAKLTEDKGYQPFGLDWRTVNITNPGFAPAYKRLVELDKRNRQ